MVAFCTFGVVQSFGVYQDYYGVGSHFLFAGTRPNPFMILYRSTANDFDWAQSVANQLHWINASLLRLCHRVTCWPTVWRWILPPLPAIGFCHLPFLVKEFHFLIFCCLDLYYALFSRIFMLSLAQPHHYCQNLLSQGMGIIFIPALTITSHYFHKKRSMAMGIVISSKQKNWKIYLYCYWSTHPIVQMLGVWYTPCCLTTFPSEHPVSNGDGRETISHSPAFEPN